MKKSVTVGAFVLLMSGSASAQQLVNGSFEDDYDGWTLSMDGTPPDPMVPMDPGNAGAGIWTIFENGTSLSAEDDVLDYADGGAVAGAGCIAAFVDQLVAPTDGTKMALQLQGDLGQHRMYQDVTLAAEVNALEWDMAYDNSTVGTFGEASQQLSINVRDTADVILTTLFVTEEGVAPDTQNPLTGYSADLTAYAGQTVRIDVTLLAAENCFPMFLDNLRIVNNPPIDIDDGLDEGPAKEDEDGGCMAAGGQGLAFGLFALLASLRRRRR
jgi:hypothetical protein